MFYGRRIELLEEKVSEMEGQKQELVTTLKLVQVGLEEHKNMFKEHDKKEMEKYDGIKDSIIAINKEILKFNKILWIAIGVGLVLNMIGVTALIGEFGKSAIKHEVEHRYFKEVPGGGNSGNYYGRY